MGTKDSIDNFVFDFIERIEAIEDRGDLLAALYSGLDKFGFTSFLITGLPHGKAEFRHHTVLNGWPLEWYDRYMGNGYYAVDAVASHARRAVEPFYWSDAASTLEKGSLADRIMQEARELNLPDGLLVPIYGAHGGQYAVTMAGHEFDRRERSKAALYMMAMYSHHRACSLNVESQSELKERRRRVRLTVREQECLRWVAIGKTSGDIGVILGVTERTANAHVLNAMMKLGAVNRTHAVVEALRGRHIVL